MFHSNTPVRSTQKDQLYPFYDAIVIGAGIAGLICGTFLAKTGKKVLIVEQHSIPGGYCTSFKRKGFNFDAAVHHIGGCGRWSVVGRCLRILGIEMDFSCLDPMDNLIFPDFSIEIPADLERYILGLQDRYPPEKDRIKSFFQDYTKLYRATFHNEKSQILETYKNITYGDMLNRYFENDELKTILSGQWGYIGLPPSQASAIAMCQMMVNYLKDGAYFPSGGTQGFANAIFKKFIDFGGHVMLSSEAIKIHLNGTAVNGITLRGGKEISSGLLVSNIDARKTFLELLEGEMDPSFLKKIHGMRRSCSFFLLYLGLGGDADVSNLKRGFYHQATNSNSLDREWMYISVPTRICPDLAPLNKKIISVVVSINEETYEDVTNWDSFKEHMTRVILNRLEEYVPNIQKYIEVKEAATPKTLERYTSNTKGAAYGWAVTVDQMWDNRLPHESPIKNLYLAGHWTRPGPGIAAVVSSGWSVANLIIENWRQTI
ncbi:MAG: NAD(P)/FAD-dependent oxidoreductase [wastewater metagenome]|nr:NAD(P)/FAD-dependent oxidoreductase [Candidatus Loosdrechtia aerotolerans]